MYPGNQDKVKNMAVLYDGQVKMAHLAIAGSYSVNGVAALHTKILEERELKDFYEMRPEQFNTRQMVSLRDVSCFMLTHFLQTGSQTRSVTSG